MRPEILFALFESVTKLDGVGKQTASLIARVAGTRIVDMLWHLPSGLIDRNPVPTLAAATPGRIVTTVVTVERHMRPAGPRHPWRVVCRDDNGEHLNLVFFHAREAWLAKLLPDGERRIVSGNLERFDDTLEMVHPDHVVNEGDSIAVVEPVYRVTEGLTTRAMGRIVDQALLRVPMVPEWLDQHFLKHRGWPSWNEAIVRAHAPRGMRELSASAEARERLAFDELLASQLALALERTVRRNIPGRPIRGDGKLRAGMMEALGFELTPSQTEAVDEILSELGKPYRMLRLLQGDVGSGKTLVALHAMLAAAEAGHQTALLAPTELLARQHRQTIADLAAATGLDVLLLTGRDRGNARARKLQLLANGDVRLVVGTHALISEGVDFHDLALIIVDEQHRFGVHQRIALSAKGDDVDTLVMTATPIPRTLQMTGFGDLDLTRLIDKPPGRTTVDTRAVPLGRLDQVVKALIRAVHKGERAYWICPLVEGSEDDEAAAAHHRFQHLGSVFGERTGLVHGRMTENDKEEAMEKFASGAITILVATTIVEVGLDVPEATIMVIENAERFGLAQLHQLRGRVGRGDARSSCLLLYTSPLSETARARIDILRRNDDGFEIAEQDLKIRGGGELLGARQSGMPEFRMASLTEQTRLLEVANDDARLILARDPELEGKRGQALRVLLHLFERQAAVRFLRSG